MRAATATISEATLWVGNVSGLAYLAHLSISEANNSTAMRVDGQGGGSGNLIIAAGDMDNWRRNRRQHSRTGYRRSRDRLPVLDLRNRGH